MQMEGLNSISRDRGIILAKCATLQATIQLAIGVQGAQQSRHGTNLKVRVGLVGGKT